MRLRKLIEGCAILAFRGMMKDGFPWARYSLLLSFLAFLFVVAWRLLPVRECPVGMECRSQTETEFTLLVSIVSYVAGAFSAGAHWFFKDNENGNGDETGDGNGGAAADGKELSLEDYEANRGY